MLDLSDFVARNSQQRQIQQTQLQLLKHKHLTIPPTNLPLPDIPHAFPNPKIPKLPNPAQPPNILHILRIQPLIKLHHLLKLIYTQIIVILEVILFLLIVLLVYLEDGCKVCFWDLGMLGVPVSLYCVQDEQEFGVQAGYGGFLGVEEEFGGGEVV